jgi:hypothetical protein
MNVRRVAGFPNGPSSIHKEFPGHRYMPNNRRSKRLRGPAGSAPDKAVWPPAMAEVQPPCNADWWSRNRLSRERDRCSSSLRQCQRGRGLSQPMQRLPPSRYCRSCERAHCRCFRPRSYSRRSRRPRVGGRSDPSSCSRHPVRRTGYKAAVSLLPSSLRRRDVKCGMSSARVRKSLEPMLFRRTGDRRR